MKDWIRDYFTFTRNEQRGLAILLGLMLLTLALSILAPIFVKDKEYDISDFKAQVEAFLADTLQKTGNISSFTKKTPAYYNAEDLAERADFLASPFNFDPNDLTKDEWQKTGLEGKVIHNILRYKEKGGKFRDKEGFRKIYGMTDSMYSILEPYIVIHEKDNEKKKWDQKEMDREDIPRDTSTYLSDNATIIELNTADSAQLLQLPGIGPSFASRIIKYRKLLGGYVSVEQIMEIKGMDSARFSGIRDHLTADPSLVLKMDLNSVAFKEMMRHPYFEYYLVKMIFNYKDRIKSFDSVGQLRNMENMYPELYEKISPYLRVKQKDE
jgi:competence protein ComEA